MNQLSPLTKKSSSQIDLGPPSFEKNCFLGRIWVKLIENTLIQSPKIEINAQKVRSIISSILTSNSLPFIATSYVDLYQELSNSKISFSDYPYLEEAQNNLTLYAINVERSSFCSEPCEPVGVNRIFSHIAFINFLKSSQGKNIINTFTSFMQAKEQVIFNETLRTLTNDLAPDYIEILSLLEAHSILEQKKLTSLSDLRKNLFTVLTKNLSKYNQILVPLGWELPTPLLGHHMFLYLHKDVDNHSLTTLHIIDTMTQALLNTHPITSRCSDAYHLDNVDEKIQKIANLLPMQSASYAIASLLKLEKPLDQTSYPDLLELNYELTIDEEPLEPILSSLSNWDCFGNITSTLMTFQPLLQVLAKKTDKNRSLTINQENNLKHYFELIMHSFKLSLINKFPPTDYHQVKAAIHRSISESVSNIR